MYKRTVGIYVCKETDAKCMWVKYLLVTLYIPSPQF